MRSPFMTWPKKLPILDDAKLDLFGASTLHPSLKLTKLFGIWLKSNPATRFNSALL